MKNLSACFICAASILLGYWINNILSSINIFSNKEEGAFLVIGILSAQNNFIYRQSIRDTWLTFTTKKIKYYFLVGSQACEIPLEDRISHYECTWNNVHIPDYANEEVEFTTSSDRTGSGTAQLKVDNAVAGFYFHVAHPVVIRKFNLISGVVEKYNAINVSLINSFTGEVMVSASFNHVQGNKTFLSKQIEPYVLPKGFEGQIVIDIQSSIGSSLCFEKWDTLGVLQFLYVIPYKGSLPIKFDQEYCTPFSLTFTLYNVSEIHSYLSLREDRIQKWKEELDDVKDRLIVENKKYRDILFLDVVDVYSNLPRKLLHFFKMSVDLGSFQFLLKTDDDTFVNLKGVIEGLEKISSSGLSTLYWWWSSFRIGWAVQTIGKWKEYKYRSLTYPPFPCGAGYVLSYNTVNFLATNSPLLRYFQGEDVSMGIWVAGLNISTYDEKELWECSEICNAKSYIRTSLSVDGMYNTWTSYIKCNNICSDEC